MYYLYQKLNIWQVFIKCGTFFHYLVSKLLNFVILDVSKWKTTLRPKNHTNTTYTLKKKRYKSGDTVLSYVASNKMQNVKPMKPNIVWYTDITYLKCNDEDIYLSLIVDHYSRKIISWHLAKSMHATESLKALNKAVWSVPSTKGIIHHSDRRSQYRSEIYTDALTKFKMIPSMTDGGKPYQNAIKG